MIQTEFNGNFGLDEVNYPPTAKLMGWASDFTDS